MNSKLLLIVLIAVYSVTTVTESRHVLAYQHSHTVIQRGWITHNMPISDNH